MLVRLWCSGYLQAFRRTGMPKPLDVWRRDSVGCAAQGLSAPPWYGARVLQQHRFLPYFWTHCETRWCRDKHDKKVRRFNVSEDRTFRAEEVFLLLLFLTVNHKCECEILVESVFLVSYKDRVLPSILFCNIPDNQGTSTHVVSGALLCCNRAILQPARKKKSPLSKVERRDVSEKLQVVCEGRNKVARKEITWNT